MVTYRYNFVQDLKFFLQNKKKKDFFASENIYIIKWTFKNYIKFLYQYFFRKIGLPTIKTNKKIICYLVSSGTWGAYELPNKIFICPLEMENLSMSFKNLIKHEIIHLKYEHKVKNMTHKEKERFINSK